MGTRAGSSQRKDEMYQTPFEAGLCILYSLILTCIWPQRKRVGSGRSKQVPHVQGPVVTPRPLNFVLTCWGHAGYCVGKQCSDSIGFGKDALASWSRD